MKAECHGLHGSLVGGAGGIQEGYCVVTIWCGYGMVWYGMVTIWHGAVAQMGWQWHAGGVTAHFSWPSLSICKTG